MTKEVTIFCYDWVLDLRTLLHGSCFQVLGNGFEVISVGKKKLVRSVPTELNKDHNEILDLAQVCPIFFFTVLYLLGIVSQIFLT